MVLRHHLLATWTAVLCLAVGLLVSFQLTLDVRAQQPPHVPQAEMLSITALPAGTPTGEALNDLRRTAETAQATVYRVSYTPGDSVADRQFDLVYGPSEVAQGQVATFDPTDRVAVNLDPDSQTLDPAGFFVVDGPQGAGASMARDLVELGYTAAAERQEIAAHVVETLISSGQGTLVLVAGLALIVTAVFDATRRQRIHAVQSSLGHTATSIVGRDLATFAQGYLAYAGVLLALSLGALYLYNGWARSAPLIATGVMLVPVVLALGSFAYVMAFAVVPRLGIRDAIAGRQPHRSQKVMSMGVACICLMVVAALAGTTATQTLRLREDISTLQRWTALDGYVAVNYLDPDEPDETFSTPTITQFASYARERDRSGDALLFYDSPGGLVVNDAYLALSGWTASSTQTADGQPAVLIPEGTADDVARQAIQGYADSAGWFGGDLAADNVALVFYPRGQELPLFNPLGGLDPQMAIDPIMLLTGPGLEGLPDPLIDGASVQSGGGDLLLADRERIVADLEAAGFRGSVSRLIDISEQGRMDLRHAQAQLSTRTAATLIGALVLIGLATVMVGSHVQMQAQQIRSVVTHGGGFAAAHWRFLLGWAALSTLALAAQHALSGPHPSAFTVGATLAWLLMGTAVYVLLRLQHSAIIRTTMSA